MKPLKIYVCRTGNPAVKGADVVPYLNQLLREYQYSSHGKVDIEILIGRVLSPISDAPRS